MFNKQILAVLILIIYCSSCSIGSSNNNSATTTNTSSEVTIGALTEIENSTDVATDTVYQYIFPDDINTDTVTASTFFIVPTTSVTLSNSVISALSFDNSVCDAGRAVDAAVECAQERCTLTPASSLAAGRGYTVCLTSDITYSSGESFEGDALNFRTAISTDAPEEYVLDTRYFSNSSYTEPAFESMVNDFQHIDPDAVMDTLFDAVNHESPVAVHGNSFLFDPCPSTGSIDVATGTIYVPGNYQTIQEAINAAGNYQTIQVTAGLTYKENLVVNGKFVHLVSSSNTELVDLKAADETKPNITLNCGGGALVYGFQIRDGLYGIKGNGTFNGVNVLQGSIVQNVTTGIVMQESSVVITDNTFQNIGDGINLVKCNGLVSSNTFIAPDDIGVYLYGPVGIKVLENTFNDGAGQGAIFITGGSAVVEGNDLNLSEQAFGIFVEFTDASLGLKTEIISNVIDDAIGTGIVILGNGGTETEAFIKDNIVRNTGTAIDNPKFEWMDYYAPPSDLNQTATATILLVGFGIAVIDAKADQVGNTSDGNVYGGGYCYMRSCGTLDSNTGDNNQTVGMYYIQDGDVDGCSEITHVTYEYNGYIFTTSTILGNPHNLYIDSSQGLSVPAPPLTSSSPEPSQDG